MDRSGTVLRKVTQDLKIDLKSRDKVIDTSESSPENGKGVGDRTKS